MATPQDASAPPPVGRIVVGVDGSSGSLAAVCWAVHEASLRGVAVHAVTAWELPVESTFGDMRTVGDFHPVSAAEEILVTALADVGVSAQGQTVTTAVVEGHPAEVLLQAAEDSELLVVGSDTTRLAA
ncbi:MAG: universal stress protein [Pseudonocardiaceae bacterium]